MVRRVLSLLRGHGLDDPALARTLDLNAFALAEDVELTVLLAGRGVELAVEPRSGADERASDLRAIVGSGVAVHAAATDVADRGLRDDDLLAGVRSATIATVVELIVDNDVIIGWGRP